MTALIIVCSPPHLRRCALSSRVRDPRARPASPERERGEGWQGRGAPANMRDDDWVLAYSVSTTKSRPQAEDTRAEGQSRRRANRKRPAIAPAPWVFARVD